MNEEDLKLLRSKIDEIDNQLLDLIIKRKVSDEFSSEFGLVFYNPEEGNDLLTFLYVMFTANL